MGERTESLGRGLLVGLLVALLLASAWTAAQVTTEFQYEWLALAIGLVVGLSVRRYGVGASLRYRVAGVILTVLAILANRLFTAAWQLAEERQMGFFSVLGRVKILDFLSLQPGQLDVLDHVFFGLALLAAFVASAGKRISSPARPRLPST